MSNYLRCIGHEYAICERCWQCDPESSNTVWCEHYRPIVMKSNNLPAQGSSKLLRELREEDINRIVMGLGEVEQ